MAESQMPDKLAESQMPETPAGHPWAAQAAIGAETKAELEATHCAVNGHDTVRTNVPYVRTYVRT